MIQESDVVAVPRAGAGEQAALAIAAEYIGDKPVLHCDMPMTRDRAARDASHDRAADTICALLDEGKTVAFLDVYKRQGHDHGCGYA